MIKKIISAIAHVMLVLVATGLIDQAVRWALKKYDPVYRKIFFAKTGHDISATKEQVFAVLNKNGQITTVQGR